MTLFFRMTIVSLLGMLVACSSTPRHTVWPVELPPKQYFVTYYQQDPDFQKITKLDTYLLWIRRFYFGWDFYRRGWLQATDELTATLNTHEEKVKGKRLMLAIGAKISAEWAKDRTLRVINTRHMIIWGNALNNSMVKKQQFSVLSLVKNDVESLLKREIKPKEIITSRYYNPEPFANNLTEDDNF